MRRLTTPWLLLLLLVAPGCDADGGAAAAALVDARAALEAGELDAAYKLLRSTEGRLDESDPRDLAAHRAFLAGLHAWARSEAFEQRSKTPQADPTDHERAVASTEDALAAWRRACARRSDWPAARRNVERALLRLKALRDRRAPDQKQPKPAPGNDKPEATDEPPQDRPPPPSGETGEGENPRPDAADPKTLSPQEVMALLDRLAEKQQEKQTLRREKRAGRAPDMEKDW